MTTPRRDVADWTGHIARLVQRGTQDTALADEIMEEVKGLVRLLRPVHRSTSEGLEKRAEEVIAAALGENADIVAALIDAGLLRSEPSEGREADPNTLMGRATEVYDRMGKLVDELRLHLLRGTPSDSPTGPDPRLHNTHRPGGAP